MKNCCRKTKKIAWKARKKAALWKCGLLVFGWKCGLKVLSNIFSFWRPRRFLIQKLFEFLFKIGQSVRYLRLKKGLTQEYLAEKAELGFNYIYRLENKQLNVTVDTIEKIMKALEIDINTFFDVETQNRENEFNQLIEEIEHLPK